MKSLEQHINERLVLSKNKSSSIFDNIKPISNPSGDMIDILYDSLDAWIYRDKEDERYDLLRVYESEDELPLYKNLFMVASLSIDKTTYRIQYDIFHNGKIVERFTSLSELAKILGKGDMQKGYGVIDYIIKDIDM